MGFNRFNILIVIQVVFIGLTTSLFIWASEQEYMKITQYSLVVLWLIQLLVLINYINRISRDLNKFIANIKYKDPTIKFDTSKKNPFRNLHQSFEEIMEAFGQVRIEKENEHQFFQTSIEHVNVGLIAFKTDGHILLCNKAAKSLLGVNSLVNISSLKRVQRDLPERLENIKAKAEIITLRNEGKLLKLSLNATNLKIRNELIKLVSIQNITIELEQEEMDAWQKLIKVITHEILNSVSPITLLSSGLINIFEKDGLQTPLNKLNEENIKESLTGLKVIKNRSKSLSAFVDDYRTNMQIPAPQFEEVSIAELFASIEVLFKNEFVSKNIIFKWEAGQEKILADKKLIEQILINLVNNSVFFTQNTNKPAIIISSQVKNNQIQIIVQDNGQGIEEEVMNQVFIPFFSTKEKGSGIGLSLSRQIMRLHNGSISIDSEPQKGCRVTLSF